MKMRNVCDFSGKPKNARAAPERIFGGAAYGGYCGFKTAKERGLDFDAVPPKPADAAFSRKYRPDAGERGYG